MSENDVILHTLPLHHIHGIINVLNTGLYYKSTIEMHPKFDSKTVWDSLLRQENPFSVYMAVPTIYYNLIKYYEEELSRELTKKEIRNKLSKLRLFVSGSSSLPAKAME